MVWIIVLAITLIVGLVLCASVLPKIYLKLKYTVKDSDDRCIKRIYERRGQSLLFEPAVKWRKFIKQYIISERNGKKIFTAKLSPEISYIEFDIAVFDSRNSIQNVIKVKDYVKNGEFTGVYDLPDETSYVAVNVLRADNAVFEDHLTAKIPAGKLWTYILLTSIVLLIVCTVANVCLSNIFGGLFRQSYVLDSESALISAAVIGALVLLNLIITLITVRVREKKFSLKVNGHAKQ